MSCCGQKRQASRNLNTGISHKENKGDKSQSKETPLSQQNVVFRYLGNQSLSIKGISGNKTYHFSVKTPEILVFAEDVALMRGYSALTELKAQKV